jgi:sugar/nucleoside kinase (ribokinase family)
MPQVACLGVLVADLLGRPIDSLPPHGRLGLVDRMELHIGGCAANTGIDLAKLGVDVAILGKVGEDGLGEFMRNALSRANADVSGILVDPGVGTSASMVLIDSNGERTFLHHTGANAQYFAHEVNWGVLDNCSILHVAGAFIMPGMDGEPMAGVLSDARAQQITTSLDTVWDATGRWMQVLGPCLPHCDYFMPSIGEAQELTGLTDHRDVAEALLDRGVGTVVVKLGPDGCYVRTGDIRLSVPGFSVDAVDGTGSGDAFDAGFLLGVLEGWDLERTARFANAVGALCVTAIGATNGVRSRMETEAFIAAQAPPPLQ